MLLSLSCCGRPCPCPSPVLTVRCPRLLPHIPCPSLGSQHSSRGTLVSLADSCIWKPRPGQQMCLLAIGFSCFWLFPVGRARKYDYTYPHRFTCLHGSTVRPTSIFLWAFSVSVLVCISVCSSLIFISLCQDALTLLAPTSSALVSLWPSQFP